MKKALLSLVALGVLCPMLSGCVDENPNVVLVGAVSTRTEDIKDEPKCETDDLAMTAYVPVCDSSKFSELGLTLVFKNYITGEVPWSGGGGGSGTTYSSEQANPGVIWIDRIYLKCHSIVDKCAPGDEECFKEYETPCSSEEALEVRVSVPVTGSEGSICYPIIYSVAPIVNWISAYAEDPSNAYANIEVYGHYHDSGKMSGYTSHSILQFREITSKYYNIYDYCNYCADIEYCCSDDYDFDFCPSGE